MFPGCLNVSFFPEAQSFHRQQRWYGAGPRSCSASAWMAKGWEFVPESHQQNLPTRKLPVWEFFQLRHKYPFSNQECLSHQKLRAGVLKKLLDSFSSSSLCESYSCFYFYTMQASCNMWQCTMDYKYASCHLFRHIRVPLSTLQLHFHSEKQQQLGLFVQVMAVFFSKIYRALYYKVVNKNDKVVPMLQRVEWFWLLFMKCFVWVRFFSWVR